MISSVLLAWVQLGGDLLGGASGCGEQGCLTFPLA
jgi:hypothetical protein